MCERNGHQWYQSFFRGMLCFNSQLLWIIVQAILHSHPAFTHESAVTYDKRNDQNYDRWAFLCCSRIKILFRGFKTKGERKNAAGSAGETVFSDNQFFSLFHTTPLPYFSLMCLGIRLLTSDMGVYEIEALFIRHLRACMEMYCVYPVTFSVDG